MKTIVAQVNQTFADLCLIATGGVSYLEEFCALNDVSPSDDPEVGKAYYYDYTENSTVAAFFSSTAETATAEIPQIDPIPVEKLYTAGPGIDITDNVISANLDSLEPVVQNLVNSKIQTEVTNRKNADDLLDAKIDAQTETHAADIAELTSELYEEANARKAADDLKLDKSNPTGTGSLTLGRHPSGDASTYVARFGNGTSDDDTSNAMQCDYNGNFKVSGEVTDGSGNVLSTKVTGINVSTASAMSVDDYAALETKDATTLYLLYEEE